MVDKRGMREAEQATRVPLTESYKYTEIERWVRGFDGVPALKEIPEALRALVREYEPYGQVLVFYNGAFTNSPLPAGVQAELLVEAEGSDLTHPLLSSYTHTYALRARPHSKEEREDYRRERRIGVWGDSEGAPLSLILLHYSDDTHAASVHSALALTLEEHTELTLFELFVGPQEARYWQNHRLTLTLSPHAVLRHYRIQMESPESVHTHVTHAALQEHAQYHSALLALGAKLSRQEVHSNLSAQAALSLAHVYCACREQHMDSFFPVFHGAPHSKSDVQVRGILSDRARGIVYGRAEIAAIAEDSEAHQHLHHRLLSEQAELNVRPELIIHTDDVRCSHGAATGTLDAGALFYLQARGLSFEDAQALLVEGFVQELFDGIDVSWVRERMMHELHASSPLYRS